MAALRAAAKPPRRQARKQQAPLGAYTATANDHTIATAGSK
jgi:hypothetical protein